MAAFRLGSVLLKNHLTVPECDLLVKALRKVLAVPMFTYLVYNGDLKPAGLPLSLSSYKGYATCVVSITIVFSVFTYRDLRCKFHATSGRKKAQRKRDKPKCYSRRRCRSHCLPPNNEDVLLVLKLCLLRLKQGCHFQINHAAAAFGLGQSCRLSFLVFVECLPLDGFHMVEACEELTVLCVI